MLIDAATLGEGNVIKQATENILKCKSFTIDIQCMWNVKVEVIRVITRTIGTISKSFRKCLRDIPWKQKIKEIRKTVGDAGLCMHTGSINVNVQNIQYGKQHCI